jgi:uncharacterized protein YjiS (DUF1127 family)
MLTHFLFVAVGPIRGWYRRRAERKAMWMATDGLSRLPGDVLDDIGISRDEITALFIAAEMRNALSARGSVEPKGEFVRPRPPGQKPVGVGVLEDSRRTDDSQTLPVAEFPYDRARSRNGVRQRARPQGVSSSCL